MLLDLFYFRINNKLNENGKANQYYKLSRTLRQYWLLLHSKLSRSHWSRKLSGNKGAIDACKTWKSHWTLIEEVSESWCKLQSNLGWTWNHQRIVQVENARVKRIQQCQNKNAVKSLKWWAHVAHYAILYAWWSLTRSKYYSTWKPKESFPIGWLDSTAVMPPKLAGVRCDQAV